MNCEDIFEKTDEYLEGWLSEDECGEFEAHIAECESCRKNVEFAKKLNGVVSGMPSVEPPSDFLETLHKKIASDGKTVRFYKRWQPYGALAACILVAVVIRANTVKDLNDSGAYLHRETPMPTAYSQTAQPEVDMSDVNAQTVTDSGSEVGNTEGNASVGNVVETPLPRAVKYEDSSKKTVEKTKDVSISTAVPEMSASTVDMTEKAAQPTAKTENKAVASSAEASKEIEPDNAAADDVSTSGESVPIVQSNKAAGNMPMVTGAAVQPVAGALPQAASLSEDKSDKKKSSGGSGSASASSSGVSLMTAFGTARQVNVIDAAHKDKVLKIISELGIKENGGEYTAAEKEYETLIEKLSECGIEFAGVCTREGNNVRFVIEWE